MQIYQQNLTNLQTNVFGRQLVKMDKTIKQLNKAGETQANKFDISHKIVTPGTSQNKTELLKLATPNIIEGLKLDKVGTYTTKREETISIK